MNDTTVAAVRAFETIQSACKYERTQKNKHQLFRLMTIKDIALLFICYSFYIHLYVYCY